jgi:polyisoprenoid-binding protein YceI
MLPGSITKETQQPDVNRTNRTTTSIQLGIDHAELYWVEIRMSTADGGKINMEQEQGLSNKAAFGISLKQLTTIFTGLHTKSTE